MVTIQRLGSASHLVVTKGDGEMGLETGAHPLAATIMGRVAPPLPPPDDRTGSQELGFRHQWPGVYATAQFGGDGLIMAFDDSVNRYRVTLDEGAGSTIIISRPARNAVRLAGLGEGPHSVRIDKINESLSGVGEFAGFFLPPDGQGFDRPAAMGRQIEIIGDSDSVGYGNTSSTRDCTGDDVFLTTDTMESYGPSVARHFQADYQLNAMSGIGLVRNYGGVMPGRTMTTMYSRVLFDEPVLVAPDAWRPNVIVLALGSNDFASPMGEGEQWTDEVALRGVFETTYLRFIQGLRADNPAAFFLLVAWEEYGRDYVGAHEAVLESLQAERDMQAGLVILPAMEKTGCDWHPSLEDHQRTADAIIRYLEARPTLWGPVDHLSP